MVITPDDDFKVVKSWVIKLFLYSVLPLFYISDTNHESLL